MHFMDTPTLCLILNQDLKGLSRTEVIIFIDELASLEVLHPATPKTLLRTTSLYVLYPNHRSLANLDP